MGTPIATTYEDTPPTERAPGQFARHARTGAPWVTHPTETTKGGWPGNKADLIALCAQRGLFPFPENVKVTVAFLQNLLGPCPKRVQYGRPSSLGKQIENMTNIQKWSERAVALGLFLATYGDFDSADPFQDLHALDDEHYDLSDQQARDLLDRIAVKAKNLAQAGLAADRGTYTHERTEDLDEERDWIEAAAGGEDLGLPVEVQSALMAAWSKMLATFDIEILAVEATCVDDTWRQAGTLDRICRLRRDLRFITTAGEFVTLPAGWVGILDIKTGKLRLDAGGFVSYWHGYSVQLASYAQSVRYDPDTDVRTPWEWEIDQHWAVIAHLDVLSALDGEAKCRLVLVDLEAGRYAGGLCVAARDWEKRRDVFSIPTEDLTVSEIVRPAQHPAAVPAGEPDDFDAPMVTSGSFAVDTVAAMLGVDTIDQMLAVEASADDFDVPMVAKPATEHGWLREAAAQRAAIDAAHGLGGVATAESAPPQENPAPPAVAAVPGPALPTDPDEGADLSGPDYALGWALLQEHFGALEETGRSWMWALVRQSEAHGVDFHAKGRTHRRFSIYCGLIALATVPLDDDDIVRALVALAMRSDAPLFAGVELGHAVGALSVSSAIVFAQLVDELIAGQLSAVVDDDGTMRLTPAA